MTHWLLTFSVTARHRAELGEARRHAAHGNDAGGQPMQRFLFVFFLLLLTAMNELHFFLSLDRDFYFHFATEIKQEADEQVRKKHINATQQRMIYTMNDAFMAK